MKSPQTLTHNHNRFYLDPPRPSPKCRECGKPRKRHLYLCRKCGRALRVTVDMTIGTIRNALYDKQMIEVDLVD